MFTLFKGSETASYTFHPFSGNTCPYSKANICWGEEEEIYQLLDGYNFPRDANMADISLTSPLETGKANFINTSKMDFLRVSSICLCANRRLRTSCVEQTGRHTQDPTVAYKQLSIPIFLHPTSRSRQLSVLMHSRVHDIQPGLCNEISEVP